MRETEADRDTDIARKEETRLNSTYIEASSEKGCVTREIQPRPRLPNARVRAGSVAHGLSLPTP